jgi:hypothetical protein
MSKSLRRPPVGATYSGSPSPSRSPKAPEPSAAKKGASAEPAVAGTFGKPPFGKSWASARGAPPIDPSAGVPSGRTRTTGPMAPKAATSRGPVPVGSAIAGEPGTPVPTVGNTPGVSSGTFTGQPGRKGPPACRSPSACTAYTRPWVSKESSLTWAAPSSCASSESRVDSIAKPFGSLPYSSLVATTISGRPSPSRSPTAGDERLLAARWRAFTPGSGVAFPVAGSIETSAGSASRTGKPATGLPSARQA